MIEKMLRKYLYMSDAYRKLYCVHCILRGWPVAYRVEINEGNLIVPTHGAIIECTIIGTEGTNR